MKAILALAPLFLLTACLPPRMWTDFEMEYQEQAVIPSGTPTGQAFDIVIDSILTNSEDQFSFNGTGDELIEEAKLQSLQVGLTDPQGEDLSFLQSIQVYINADGYPEALLGQLTNVSGSSTMISLSINEADFKEYLKQNMVDLRLSVITDEALSQDHSLSVHALFAVHAEQYRK